MNRITQHIPAFVDYGETPPSAEFSTLPELFSVPFVKKWVDNADYGTFAQDSGSLLAVSPGGEHWWVVGYFSAPVDFLPQWQEGKPGIKPPNQAPRPS